MLPEAPVLTPLKSHTTGSLLPALRQAQGRLLRRTQERAPTLGVVYTGQRPRAAAGIEIKKLALLSIFPQPADYKVNDPARKVALLVIIKTANKRRGA
jgi:5,10-methylene-tetrahydrofolate dehydrogenase/methenyl tetrahydrofolate cyclohydrolase